MSKNHFQWGRNETLPDGLFEAEKMDLSEGTPRSHSNGICQQFFQNQQWNLEAKARVSFCCADSKLQQPRKKHGGSLFSSLLSLGARFLPMVAKPLAKGALSALGNLGVNKILGKGQSGGFLIPNNKIELLIKNKNLLTQKQKEHILNSLQSGGQVVVTPSAKQRGGALGTLLASIGIPLAMELGKKLFGSGLHVPSKGKGLQVGPKPGMMLYQPPPFIGNWGNPTGSGTKKKIREKAFSSAQTAHSLPFQSWEASSETEIQGHSPE